jgi:hypothetical protein
MTSKTRAKIQAAARARWAKYRAKRQPVPVGLDDEEVASRFHPDQVNGHDDTLPPHSVDAEMAALGCVLQAASERDADALLASLRPALFYDERCRNLHQACVQLRGAHRAVDPVTVLTVLDGAAAWVRFVQDCQDKAPSLGNFPSYLAALEDQAFLRKTAAQAARVAELIRTRTSQDGLELDLEQLRAALRELGEDVQKPATTDRPVIEFLDPETGCDYEPPPGQCLVGDFDLSKGYEGVALIAGPPGSGKSLAASALALAGVIGPGAQWMGRTVQRRFRSLVIQAENGAMRLKTEFAAMQSHFPRALNAADWLRWSKPPEGGLPFHRPEFRRAIRRQVDEFAPDLVILDPWTAVAADDSSADVVDKLAEIRSCLPAGDACPCLLVIAHTRKPKAEGLRRGRGLLAEVSGSLALGATARTVFVILPFSDDIQDDRVLFSYAKANNLAKPPGDTVWHRRLGGLWVQAEADPEEFWRRDDDTRKDRAKVNRDQLRQVYGERLAMSRKDLVAGLVAAEACSYQTAMRITADDGLLVERGWIQETPGGLLALA